MRIQPFTHEDLDRIADEFEAEATRGLRVAMKTTSIALTAALTPISIDDLARMSTRWARFVIQELLPSLRSIFVHGAEDVRGAIFTGDAAGIPSSTDLFRNPAVTDFMSRAENRMVGVGNDLWEHARSEIMQGLDAGESMEELAGRLTTAVDLTVPRARTVARTEAMAASNAGAFYELRSYELEALKEWVATTDELTRETHLAADHQEVDLLALFQVGEASLLYPGDPNGPPGEVINCRCTVVFEIADDEVVALTAAVDELAKLNCPSGARWGTPGDFTRCVRIMREHLRDPEGFCAQCHKQQTGKWPGEDRG